MSRQGYIDYNARFAPENSGKTASYDMAIRILDRVLKHQSVVDMKGKSLFEVTDIDTINEVMRVVKAEVKKMKNNLSSIFDYGDPNQTSYPLRGFCTAALKSLKTYALYEHEVVEADEIVRHEANPKTISEKLIAHFDITKEGEDRITMNKQRKGQDYFRRLILANYGGRCALTGINIPQVLLASHIIPWSDKSHIKERLNPTNGICLSALYDKAFDKGLITISPDNYKVILSSALMEYETEDYYDKHFKCIEGKKLMMPTDYKPNPTFLAYHREKVFMGI